MNRATDVRNEVSSTTHDPGTTTQPDPRAYGPLLDELSDAVSLHDAEGVYLYASDTFHELFGWDPDQLVGRDPYELFHPDDLPEIRAAHSATVEGRARTSVQYRLRCSDGSYRWVETTSRMTPDGRIVAVTREIADRRSLLHALDNERLVAERLREVERERQAFLTAIAHRARHPVTALAGFSQLLQSGRVRDDGSLETIYERLVVNTSQLSQLIEVATRADELSRRANVLQRQPVDLARLVRDVASDFWDTEHVEQTAMTLDLPDQALVFVDRERVDVLVRALLQNAVKHTPVGTRVWVRIEQQADGRLLVVEDDGPGVPDGLKSPIFDRLVHGDLEGSRHDPGLGLGLYLVAQVARAHDGRAWVEDRDGGGASFRVFLPAGERTASSPSVWTRST